MVLGFTTLFLVLQSAAAFNRPGVPSGLPEAPRSVLHRPSRVGSKAAPPLHRFTKRGGERRCAASAVIASAVAAANRPFAMGQLLASVASIFTILAGVVGTARWAVKQLEEKNTGEFDSLRKDMSDGFKKVSDDFKKISGEMGGLGEKIDGLGEKLVTTNSLVNVGFSHLKVPLANLGYRQAEKTGDTIKLREEPAGRTVIADDS